MITGRNAGKNQARLNVFACLGEEKAPESWSVIYWRAGPQSFPRKRESTPQVFGNRLPTDWIPAFAGMTGVSKMDLAPNDTITRILFFDETKRECY